MPDYGSGTLGEWSGNAHGVVGNFATADIGIIGDSITTLGYNDLTGVLADRGKTLAVNYWSGRPTTPALDWLMSNTVLPPVVIVACGTNDIFNPPVMEAQVARAVRAGTRFFWIDVQCSRTAQSSTVQIADQRNSMWVNKQIWQGMNPDDVIPWSQWFASQPNRLSLYLSDGVHPKPVSGTAFWAAVIDIHLNAQGVFA